MLSQKAIQLWQGYPARFHSLGDNVELKPNLWSPPLRLREIYLHRRRKIRLNLRNKTLQGTLWCSHGIRSSSVDSPLREECPQGIVRVSDGGAKQLCYGSDDLSLASRSATGNAADDARTAEELTGLFDGYGRETVEDVYTPDNGSSATDSITESFQLDEKDGLGDGLAKISLRAPAQVPQALKEIDIESSSESSTNDLNMVVEEYASDNAKQLNAFEKFSLARVAGKDLDKVEDSVLETDNMEEDLQYYFPKVGDYVMGVVVSGSQSKLDIDIGARKLGHMLRKDVIPLDRCNVHQMSWEWPGNSQSDSKDTIPPSCMPLVVYDDEVLNSAIEALMPVDIGTVLTMKVVGETMSGRSLLSTRAVARTYAWQRVSQIMRQNVPLEIHVTEWNSAGLISWIEGVRAFLPSYNLIKQPTESSLKDYVGKRLCVMITTVDAVKSSLVVSEKLGWIAQNIHVGALIEGIVKEIHTYGVQIQIRNTDVSGLLHISNIARARVKQIKDVFAVGEEIKVMVAQSPLKSRIAFSTADLEAEDGLMLRDKEAVFRDAEKMSLAFRDAHPVQASPDNENYVDIEEEDRIIANWEWLDFSERPELVQQVKH